jgi:hypothetical protein
MSSIEKTRPTPKKSSDGDGCLGAFLLLSGLITWEACSAIHSVYENVSDRFSEGPEAPILVDDLRARIRFNNGRDFNLELDQDIDLPLELYEVEHWRKPVCFADVYHPRHILVKIFSLWYIDDKYYIETKWKITEEEPCNELYGEEGTFTVSSEKLGLRFTAEGELEIPEDLGAWIYKDEQGDCSVQFFGDASNGRRPWLQAPLLEERLPLSECPVL